jgi:tRNA/tmRNA/rRNA uracil-C5-methylase (TrmA/RlmC/RlmD family)
MKDNNKIINNIDPSAIYIATPLDIPILEDAKTFFATHCGENFTYPVYLGNCKGWRTLAKLAVRSKLIDKYEPPLIGLFRPDSHDVICIDDSINHHPSINAVVKIVRNACNKAAINGYIEGNGIYNSVEGVSSDSEECLRYIVMAVERVTGKVQLTLVWNGHPPKSRNDLSSSLHSLITGLCPHSVQDCNLDTPFSVQNTIFHSIWVNFHPANLNTNNNVICSSGGLQDWMLLAGEKVIKERLGAGMETSACQVEPVLSFPPYVFRQSNIDAFSVIVRHIRNILSQMIAHTKTVHPSSSIDNQHDINNSMLPRCIELYGGVGTIGLNCLDLLRKLFCSDENPHNADCFLEAVKSLPPNLATRATYQSGSAVDIVQSEKWAKTDFEVAIVDPPRKGLDAEVIQALLHSSEEHTRTTCLSNVKKLIYVSCGFKAFKRDAMLLASRWKLVHAEGHVLFPGSDHVETLAVFDKL